MYADVFEARWKCMSDLHKQGHVELEELLGVNAGLGAAVRTGLLRRSEQCCDFERYQGYVPTGSGDRFMLYVPEQHVIMVRSSELPAFQQALACDPCPEAVFHSGFDPRTTTREPLSADPTRFADERELAEARHADILHGWNLRGYRDFATFRAEHSVADELLLASRLCVRDDHAAEGSNLTMLPTPEGELYLHVVRERELVLIKPGMALQLLDLLDPTTARYWTSCMT